jgi:hypothetical protein
MSKKTIAWWVAASTAVIFLLGIGPLGSYSSLGDSGTVSFITGIALLFVGVVAAVVALYWNRSCK